MLIGTAEYNSTFYSQGIALKNVLINNGFSEPIEVILSENASVQNAYNIQSKVIDFGYMASNWIGRAKEGQSPFTHPIDLRMVSPMNAGPSFFISLASSAIFTIADIKGKRVCVGPEKSGVINHARSILGALKIGFDQFTPVFLDFASGAKALARGEIDVQLQCPIPNKVMRELDGSVDIRILTYTSNDLETVLRECPIYHKAFMRKGMLRSLTEDVPQPSVINVLVTNASTDIELVRQVALVCYRDSEELARLEPLYIGMKDLFVPLTTLGSAAFEFGGVKLHPGALDAYHEVGLI